MTTNRAEPGDVETLNIRTEFTHSHNKEEYVLIGVVPLEAGTRNGVVSLVLSHFDKKFMPSGAQACLTLEEVDMVIGGLTLAKFRMEILQMDDGPEKALIAELTKEWSIDDWDATQHSVGDLHYDVSEWVRDQPVDFDLSTEAGIFEAKFYFEQHMGW